MRTAAENECRKTFVSRSKGTELALIRGFLFSLILVAGTVAFGTGAQAQPALVPVKVGLVPTDDITPLVYAIQTGMFRKAGLDVEIAPGGSGAAMAAAVVSGSYTFGKASMLSIINAHLRKLPLVMIGSEAVYDSKDPFAQLVVAADSAAKSCKDLAGTVVGTPSLNDLDALATMACVDQAGGDPTSLKLIELPQSATQGALQEHRVAATVMHEPVLAEALAGGADHTLAPAYTSISPHFVFASYFTSESYAQQHPDIVRKFMDTIYRAAAYTNTHHQATAQMMADATKAPLDIVEHMARVDGAVSLEPREIQPMIDVAAKYHLTASAFPASEMLKYAPK
jgi:NitT/TauT family transport system substrate-binding protein